MYSFSPRSVFVTICKKKRIGLKNVKLYLYIYLILINILKNWYFLNFIQYMYIVETGLLKDFNDKCICYSPKVNRQLADPGSVTNE